MKAGLIVKTLLIDNYDSYTFNLYQMIAVINGEEPFVIRNNAIEWEEIKQYQFDNIVISPGPGHPSQPDDFGICAQAIAESDVPVLGVCLGHQGIGHVFGQSRGTFVSLQQTLRPGGGTLPKL